MEQRYGKWLVLGDAIENHRVICRCDCGKEKPVNIYNLKTGKTKSCGCDKSYNSVTKHGLSHHAEYGVWKAMKARCYNKNHKNYDEYGGRGIAVCDKWKDAFDVFFFDMGQRPSSRHSIDRIDVNKGYAHDNCRWATQKTQMLNTRRSLRVAHDGHQYNVTELVAMTGMKESTIYKRISAGWTAEKIIKTPPRH